MRDLVIYGASGFARETHQIVRDLNRQAPTWNCLGFLDDGAALRGGSVHGLPVLGGGDWLRDHPSVAVAVAIGNPRTRRAVVAKLLEPGSPIEFATLVHPLAWIGGDVVVGAGTIICAGVKVTCDISIGEHVILNLDCTVGHDSVIGDFVTAAPTANISGAVRLGRGVDVGTNATIIQGVNVGPWGVIGAGTVVVRDLPPRVTAVGVPAKVIKELPPVPGEAE